MLRLPALGMAVFALSFACLAPGSSRADPVGANIADPAECIPNSVCAPDIQSAAAAYDPVTGFLDGSITFYDPLPTQTAPPFMVAPLPEYVIRLFLGHSATNGHCGDAAGIGHFESGDVAILGYAVGVANTADWTTGQLLIGGLSGTLTVPRSLSPDGRTLEYTTTNPALIGSSERCFEVSLNLDAGNGPVVDGTQYAWFAGMGPTAPPTTTAPSQTFPTVTNPPTRKPLPRLFYRPQLVGSVHVGSQARCTKGIWDVPVQVSTYQWFRGGSMIAEASFRNYRIRKSDAGHKLRCGVVITYADGRSTHAASLTKTVPRATPHNPTRPHKSPGSLVTN